MNESSIEDLRVRDHLANERTYLAWLRTSLAMVASGLGAAKFGSRHEAYALAAGGVLVCGAILLYGYATVRYRILNQEITRGRVTVGASTRGPVIAGILLVLGALIAVVLLVR